jgi:hypothetical protein
MEPDLPGGTTQTLVQKGLRQAEGRQEIQGRRMKRRGPKVVRNMAVLFDQDDVDAPLSQKQGQAGPHCSAADDNNRRLVFTHCRTLDLPGTSS